MLTRKYLIWAPLALAGMTIFYFFDPVSYSFFPKCPFFVLTGWQCPGCGSQRAIHQLLSGELSLAWSYNPLLLSLLPYLVLAALLSIPSLKHKFPKISRLLYRSTTAKFIFAIIVLFWIGRNL